MLAQKAIEECVKSKQQKNASVIAHIPEEDSWWHVHKDEEVPIDRPISIRIKYQGFNKLEGIEL